MNVINYNGIKLVSAGLDYIMRLVFECHFRTDKLTNSNNVRTLFYFQSSCDFFK